MIMDDFALSTDAYASWTDSLDEWSKDLDLTTDDGRTQFRGLVFKGTLNTRFDVACAVARVLGAGSVPTTKAGALRTIADVYINRRLIAAKSDR